MIRSEHMDQTTVPKNLYTKTNIYKAGIICKSYEVKDGSQLIATVWFCLDDTCEISVFRSR